ncbi:cytochrome P450 [Annulohypoxylon maeteangense]|uniref:cytochrome P450 n=1 Tax=Annulohypoxylon maeteangense TaxID=1927788 RepID=UPI002007626F|nr:cytochrome P450 [Annulohypoxylon maeteangense]KAI0885023.1 cytochrome P450 [Annulohypoxylon maeteangense]
MEITFVIAGLLAAIVFRFLVKRLFYPRPLPGIPYDKESSNRISGDLPNITETYNEVTEWTWPIGRRSLKYGSPIHQLFMNPFTKPYIILDDPREVSDIVMRRSKEFDRDVSSGVWQTFLPHSTIAQSVTPEYKAQRKIWQDTMNPDFLRQVMSRHVYAAAEELTKLWKVRCSHSAGNPIDVIGDFSYAALDAIWTATFGERLDLVNAQIRMVETGMKVETRGLDMHGTVQHINHLANTWRGSFWPAFARWRMQRNPIYRKYTEAKDREIDRILLDASARFQKVLDGSSDGEEHDTCAMDLVLRRSMISAQKAGKPIPDPTKDAGMRDELLLFIYAGHDTTSNTLQWFIKFITNNQDAQTKLREALKAAFPGEGLPKVADLITKDIPYLSATMEETLRCANTAPRLGRIATTDTEILGHKIPAGTQIAALPSVSWHPAPVAEEKRSSTSRAAFEKSGGVDWTLKPNAQDLDKFAPERWLGIDEHGNEVFDANALFQNAFGGGIRGCFGRRLAMMELRIMIVLIVMSFKFLPIPPEFNSFQVHEQLLRVPRQCFVKLETV